ncbi:hypothetical protein F4677DRAFT_197999 [Hypoxylon crocopeplum]|nr:hypothetical protein F4677DRAFT_197999 [Hypoxylon crocopeplum]
MDIPPPPYTETDIYSHSGRSPAAPTASNDDDASIDASSSSRSVPIYTPPETPRESHYNFAGSDDHRTVASVHSYFDSRPALRQPSGPNLVVMLAIPDDAVSPADFPYPAWASERDTTEQDWQTFLNYLMPDHSSRANSHIADRKLRAEDDVPSSPTARSIAEAQLGQIKSSKLSTQDLPSQPLPEVDSMIREWNDGFFGPRGVTIRRQSASANSSQTRVDREVPAVEPQQQFQEQTSGSRWNPFRSFEANNRGLRFGRLAIDGDRVSFGNSFEVDRNGVRWNGHSIDANPSFIPPMGRGNFPPGLGVGPDDPQQQRDFGERGWHRGRGGPWWRPGANHGHRGRRDRSPSSESSSSSSSSDSDASIGSLPDWDNLMDSQLPTTKQSVSAWLAHPEQPITKEMLRAAKSDIKAARKANNHNAALDINQQALRQEVRSLLARFRELKREQKKAGRATRREKRAFKRERRDRHRAEKREHRTQERDFRRAARDADRSSRRNGGCGGPLNQPQHPLFARGPVPVYGAPPPHVSGPDFLAAQQQRFGGRGGLFGGYRPHQHWQEGVREALRQADQARSHALSQAGAARGHAVAQAGLAREQGLQAAAAWRASPWGLGVDTPTPTPTPIPTAATAAFANNYNADYGNNNNNDDDNKKYEVADELEAQMVTKTSVLVSLLEKLQTEGEGDDYKDEKNRDIKKEEKGEKKMQSETQRQAEDLQREIEDLGKQVERLRLEADEELARKMEEEERRG